MNKPGEDQSDAIDREVNREREKRMSQAEVLVLLGIGRVSLWRLRRDDASFPKPTDLRSRALSYWREEIAAWIAENRPERAPFL